MVSAAFPLQGDQGTITLLMVIVSAVAWTATVCYWLWSRPTYGAKVLEEFDNPKNLNFDDEKETGRLTTRCARLVAYEFKAEFGEMRYNKANKCIAGDWVRRKFKDMGMRTVDIVQHMDICVELCLTPTMAAVKATRIARDFRIRARRAAVDHSK